ncbi:hypothetical protein KP509_09G034200 [Ceratopteris richardii]|uniref:Uncharacterized protein n=1 Tax=Ceratopteris richardii TaxID=49495 RepID=A0A8T2TZG2_CERRI|nr:hypothetical protein KP509_09G034200 [Ceratopteris richardii]
MDRNTVATKRCKSRRRTRTSSLRVFRGFYKGLCFRTLRSSSLLRGLRPPLNLQSLRTVIGISLLRRFLHLSYPASIIAAGGPLHITASFYFRNICLRSELSASNMSFY